MQTNRDHNSTHPPKVAELTTLPVLRRMPVVSHNFFVYDSSLLQVSDNDLRRNMYNRFDIDAEQEPDGHADKESVRQTDRQTDVIGAKRAVL